MSDKKKTLRQRLIERDGATCHYCGAVLIPSVGGFTECGLSLDHIKPVSAGGDFSLDNLVLACQRCNSAKGAKSYQEFVMSRDTDNTINFLMGGYHG